MIIKGRGSVTMPKLPRAIGNLLGYAKEVNQALQQLADRCFEVPNPQPQKQYNHPFEIFVEKIGSEIRLSVNYGRQYRNWVKSVAAGITSVNSRTQEDEIPFETSQVLRNHPDGTTSGYTALNVSTTYGIWARASYVLVDSSSDYFSSGDGDSRGYMNTDTYALFVTNVEKDDINTDPDAYEGTDDAHLYIGKVTVDANGAWTIKQYWRSDIVCPCFVMPYVSISADAGNSLRMDSSDGLLFVPPIVSGDANNSISQGTDYGAYYDAPPVVSADANNSLTEGSDGGPFYDEP